MKNYLTGAYRIFFAVLTISAIVTQFSAGMQKLIFNPVNFFSFFTIESNVFAVIVFSITAFALLLNRSTEKFDLLRGASTLYMVITGIIYTLLLSGLNESLQTTIPWVNNVLHYIMPLVLLIDWIIDPPKQAIPFKKALWWLIFPAVYLAYSLIRGYFVGWYPYPFLNPNTSSYLNVTIMSVLISAAIVGLTALIAKIGKPRNT